MNSQEFERKLSAILSADVVGYSRLMSEDEDTTIRNLTSNREIMATLIKRYNGRVVDSPGDNLLAEFSSVTQAVNCAVEIQRELAERNADLPEERRMAYRIGVNVGDIAQEGERIYGDGVNIAARLESLAEPGGICISGLVYSHIKNKLKLEYEYLGKQTVKNISEPVPVYRVLSLPKVAAQPSIREEQAYSLSDKPSIAVLPFVNMSDDPRQEYFSDGMAEEIIGVLSKLEGLKVISRTSAFYFKGKDVKLRQVGEELKVDHVLEGSVRKAGTKLRISAQLIKVDDDTHLCSETYDRELEDVFAIQDEISQAVVQTLKVKLLDAKTEPLVKDYTESTEAYELFLKGKYFENKAEYEKAIEYMEKATQADPYYVPAYAAMAGIYMVITTLKSLPSWKMKSKINALVQKAINIDENFGLTYLPLGIIKMIEYDWPAAEKNYKRAIELNPSYCYTHSGYSYYLAAVSRISESIIEAKKAVELDPVSGFVRFHLTWWLSLDDQFEKAMEVSKEMLEFDANNIWGITGVAMVYIGNRKYDNAASILQKYANVPRFASILGFCYGKINNRPAAQKILDDFLRQSKTGYTSPFCIAEVYAGMGEYDKTFEWLDRAYDVQDPNQIQIKSTWIFRDLHSDPRWTEQLKKRGLSD